ncbi:MAG: LPXTG cell wall anchor domain-containing protein [Actinomycetota bacterium]
MRKFIIGGLVGLTVLTAGSASAAADEIINVPIDTIITRSQVREGDVRTLAAASVEPDLVGATCVVESEADNQTSVHPGNDVIVTSGNDSVVIPDVEGQPGQISLASGTLTLGDEITVAVRIGSDRQFSGGIIVQLDCDGQQVAQTTTTETVPAQATTTVPETTQPGVETTLPDSTDTTVPETSDTESPSQTEASTTPTTSTDETVPAQQEGGELPATGPLGTGSFTVIALALIAGGGALILVSRRLGDTPA